ncbi:MAG: hypothetical protein NTX59_00745 [Elusimicrobia bacterium]|nr:hypothetical protein [Elusimicrobiota bacterium]
MNINKIVVALVLGVSLMPCEAFAGEDLAVKLGPAVGKEIVIQGKLSAGRPVEINALYKAKGVDVEECIKIYKKTIEIMTPFGVADMPWFTSDHPVPSPSPKGTMITRTLSENGSYSVAFPLMATASPCYMALDTVVVKVDSLSGSVYDEKWLGIAFGPTQTSDPLTYINDTFDVTYKCGSGRCEYASGEPQVQEKDQTRASSGTDEYEQRYSSFADLGSRIYTLNIIK